MSKTKLEVPIFVYVKDEDIEDFKKEYIDYDVEIFGESDKYEHSLVMLGTTGQIVTRGNIYGKTPVIEMASTSTTQTISPNKFYKWGEVSELDITLETPADASIYNEYMFQFTSGDTATTLSLPDTITWYLNSSTISANKTYQVSIVNNLAILAEF